MKGRAFDRHFTSICLSLSLVIMYSCRT